MSTIFITFNGAFGTAPSDDSFIVITANLADIALHQDHEKGRVSRCVVKTGGLGYQVSHKTYNKIRECMTGHAGIDCRDMGAG